ncbi:MAG: dihydropteroate synthase [Gammaproteobacteria bacterium]|nr:dihydropteroate synthase [Gammaproteobacteria bacterium]
MSKLLYKQSPLIMGILNVTPDSFSDGGRYVSTRDAVARGLEMVDEGADIIDIGGESTRPGSERVDAVEQKRRVLDVISALSQEISDDVLISIDTTLSDVAEAALDAGAGFVNDVTGGTDDANLMKLVAERNVPYCIMHMQGRPDNMQDNPSYVNAAKEVKEFLVTQALKIQDLGLSKNNIILDPGIGFGKRTQHNLELLNQLNQICETDYSVLLGTSRKRFMSEVCATEDPSQRMPATCATTALGVEAGVKIFRVHDVWQNRQAADVSYAIKMCK